ncbi:hypothetical protein [Kitasatospora sp. KL5]|uniref:hypothetical protein n=1 Tax=Kitasatospora sp. KL5 TaxID=3425125 RepID=UPI003D6F64CF
MTAETVRAEAIRLLPGALADVMEARPAPVADERTTNRTFEDLVPYIAGAEARDGRHMTVRVDAVALPEGRQARTFPNTTSENHVVQLSDQLSVDEVGMVLAYELGELAEARNRAEAGIGPSRTDVFRSGERDATVTALSPHDAGRLGQLNWLAARMDDSGLAPEQRGAARSDFSAMLDDLGLRPQQDSSDLVSRAEREGLAWRNREARERLTPAAANRLRELRRPLSELSAQDAAELVAYREATAGREVSGTDAAVRPQGVEQARQALEDRAREAAGARDERSALTLDELRQEAAALPPGELPKRPLMIGGGAALAGRDPDILVVDARGRWHLDPIRGIAQSADQVRGTFESGIGDPYDVAAPRERIPLDAVRMWEDQAAARGPVIDGQIALAVDGQDRLVAEVTPNDGSEPVRFEVVGTPVVATGVSPEIVPGAKASVPRIPEARKALAAELADLGTPQGDAAAAAMARVEDRPGAGEEAMGILRDHVPGWSPTGQDGKDAVVTMTAFAAWDHARAVAPGRALQAGEVGDGAYDPMVSDTWVIAGVGGAASTSSEIILEANPNASVIMVGKTVPWVQNNDAQYLAMRAKYDAEHGGDGRLKVVTGKYLNEVEVYDGPDGTPVFHVAGEEGGAYVGCLGRLARLPAALDPVDSWARENGGAVRGELMFSTDRQYLGYKLEFGSEDRTFSVEVIGAASRNLPREVFSQAEVDRVAALGRVEAPMESGNFDAGFMATTQQSRRYFDARGQDPAAAVPGPSGPPAPSTASPAARLAAIGMGGSPTGPSAGRSGGGAPDPKTPVRGATTQRQAPGGIGE